MDFKTYKYFLNFLIGLAFLSLNIIIQYAHAKDLTSLSELSRDSASKERNFSFGAEYLYMLDSAKEDWSKLLRKSQSGGNIYAGYNWDYIMLEAGYSWTTRKSKEYAVSLNEQLFGLASNSATVIRGQVRFRSTHFDLNFFSNAFGDFDVVTSAGISFARPHITFHCDDPNNNVFQQLNTVIHKTSAVFRFGLGLRYLVTNTFGVRAMWHFDKNSRINLRTVPNNVSNRPFRDANTFSIGVFGRL